MNRRTFLNTISWSIGPFWSAAAGALRPATLDLRDPTRLGVDCILNRMDPAQNYRPWFAIEVVNHHPTRLRHDVWDFGDTGGRFLEALILARQMIPANTATITAEQRIRRFVLALLNDRGVVWNPDRNVPTRDAVKMVRRLSRRHAVAHPVIRMPPPTFPAFATARQPRRSER
jgi:hypothetical protein